MARLMLAGVDEAGRGPVLGPLVVAGVLIDDEKRLAELGVRDSKKLAPKRREALEAQIREVATRVVVRAVEPGALDERMGVTSLNVIEVEEFAAVLADLAPERAVVDACDVNGERFGANVAALLGRPCAVTAEHGADDRYPVVAAASILAKVARDRAIGALAAEFGDVGSGYASDPKTRRFLEAYVQEHGDLPACARRRWKTAERLLPQNRSLLDFSEDRSP